MHSEKITSLEYQLSYYKSHNSFYDVLCDELGYSLIFDNIRPEALDFALSTVNITKLPNYFLLIQVDEYNVMSKELDVTKEYYQKTNIITLFRNEMKVRNIEGFVANRIGSDCVLCFFCLDERTEKCITMFLQSFLDNIKKMISHSTPYSISTVLSKRCNSTSDFPVNFHIASKVLDSGFYSGKGANLFMSGNSNDIKNDLFSNNQIDIYNALLKNDFDRIISYVNSTFNSFTSEQIPAHKVKATISRLIHHLEIFGYSMGVDSLDIEIISEETIDSVLSSKFLDVIKEYFLDYCRRISFEISMINNSDAFNFKVLVDLYIQEHLSEKIMLKDISNAFNFSAGYFSSLFKKYFDTSLPLYVNHCRIEKSKTLLSNSTISIEQISELVGYSSYTYFNFSFKTYCGITPRSYRMLNNLSK